MSFSCMSYKIKIKVHRSFWEMYFPTINHFLSINMLYNYYTGLYNLYYLVWGTLFCLLFEQMEVWNIIIPWVSSILISLIWKKMRSGKNFKVRHQKRSQYQVILYHTNCEFWHLMEYIRLIALSTAIGMMWTKSIVITNSKEQLRV